MADIAPLTPLRFASGELSACVAPPYDVISEEERGELLSRSPHNVVRLILPEGAGDSKYDNAAAQFERWRSDGVLVRDDQPAFYRYDQTFHTPSDDGLGGIDPGRPTRVTRRGFLALVRLTPFHERQVLPHERTLAGPKEDRLKLFRATGANLSPGFMLYRDPARLLDAPLADAHVEAEFTTPDGTTHQLAKITRAEALRSIADHVRGGALLIADGHHRYETALRYATEVDARREDLKSSHHRTHEHRYFMSFLCNEDDPHLVVLATHRLVHSLAHFRWEDFCLRARELFEVEPLVGSLANATERLPRASREPQRPTEHGTRLAEHAFLAIASGGRMARLTLRQDIDLARHPALASRPAVVRNTDVAILHGGLLEHVLGISLEAQAQKTHLTYLQRASEGALLLEQGSGNVLFVMNPTPVAAVRAAAEAGEVMPQKSTYFTPKVLTGLAIHTLDPQRSVPVI